MVRFPRLALSLLLVLCCFPSPSHGESPHLVFIMADDLRADVMSIYGGPVPTPHLQELAERGYQFERATCGYPI